VAGQEARPDQTAAAEQAGARRLLSEDLQHGQVIAGVRIENPFI
jgi:predicted nucleic acid-binding protein